MPTVDVSLGCGNTMESTARTRDRLFPAHLTPFELYMLSDDRPDYPSTFVVGWEFRGRIDRPAFERGLAFACERHPLLQAVVRPVKLHRDCWVAAENFSSRVDWGELDDPITFATEERIDLRVEPGFRMWIRQDDERSILTTQFHHAAVDGIGACQFVGDILWSYAEEFGTNLDPLPELPVAKLRNRVRSACKLELFLDSRGEPREKFHGLVDRVVRRSTPLSPCRRHDFDAPVTPAFPGILSAWLSADEYRRFKAQGLEQGLTANDSLMVKLFRTMHAWNRQQAAAGDGSLSMLIPLDLREPDSMDISAANLVTESVVHRTAEVLNDESNLAASIREEMLRLKSERHQSEFMAMMTLLGRPDAELPQALSEARSGNFCAASAIMSNTGDTTRRFHASFPRENGLVRCGNLVVDDIFGIPPLRPHSRVAVSVYNYRRRLRVCMRCDSRFFTASEAREFLEAYMGQLRSGVPAAEPSLRHR